MKKLFILILFFITSCGYQPLYVNKNNSNLVFSTIEFFGDKEINRRIMSFVSIKEDKNEEKLNQILLKSNENIIETSKDSKGRVATLKTNVEVKLIILNGDKIIKEKIFNENFSYNNKNNKFDLAKYQNEVKNNLVNKIIEQMIIYLSL